jgi:hypothetical protein
MQKFDYPYWVTPTDELPFAECDFNREIVEPGVSQFYHQGTVSIRVDDNFWQVAALPLSYRDKSIQEIVAEFWPDAKNPTYKPDSDDHEAWKKLFESYETRIRKKKKE